MGGVNNQAVGGTRVRIVFTNVPTNVSVYVPASWNGTSAGATAPVIQLTASETGAFSAVAPTSGALAQVAVSGGTAEAVYEVTTQNPAAIDSFSVPVYFSGTAAALTSFGKPIIATAALAPVGSAGTIPNFAVLSDAITVNATPSAACLPFSINPTSLSAATQSGSYSQQLIAGPASGSEIWTVSAGNQPAGLTLNSATGLLSGIPTVTGSFPFNVKVVDQGADQATLQFTLQVNAAPVISANPSVCGNPASSANLIRSEGLNEQVADFTFTCTGGGGGTATLDITVSGAVTSKILNATTGITEALAITSAGSVAGTLSGTTLTFAGLQIPSGAATVTVTNIRVNANKAAVSPGYVVTESAFISGPGTAPTVLPATPVATLEPGLGAPSIASSKNFAVCSPILPSGGAAFTVQFGEASFTSFKTQGGPANATLGSEFAANTETGYYVASGGVNNQASAGTRIRILFQNVPAGLSVYVPTSVSAVQGAVNGVLTLTAAESGAFSAVAALTPTAGNALPVAPALAQVAINGGMGEAVYEVTVQNPSAIENYAVAVYLGASGAILPMNGAMTARVNLAPVGAASNVPDFAATGTALTASAFTFCRSTQTLPTAQVGMPYSTTITASGGTAPYTFVNAASALPAGLSISSGGTITGTPTTASASFAGSVTVNDSAGLTFSFPVTMQVVPSGPPTCSNPVTNPAAANIRAEGVTEQLPDFTFACVGVGGAANISFSVSPGLAVQAERRVGKPQRRLQPADRRCARARRRGGNLRNEYGDADGAGGGDTVTIDAGQYERGDRRHGGAALLREPRTDQRPELDATKGYQVVVDAGGALTPADFIQLTPVAPRLATLGDGTLLAQHGDASLVTASSPAKPGEFIVTYLLGLGATDTPVASGAASPASSLAHPAVMPVLTIGGEQTPIAFVGLTPGLVGLYQMNFQVPANAPDDSLAVLVTQGGAASNAAILPVHE